MSFAVCFTVDPLGKGNLPKVGLVHCSIFSIQKNSLGKISDVMEWPSAILLQKVRRVFENLPMFHHEFSLGMT